MAEQFLYLTTTGRVSGKPRESEIWFVEVSGNYYVLAEQRERTQWVKNIAGNPYVHVRVGSSTFDAAARVLDPEQDFDLLENVRRLMDEKYNWSSGLPVELAPYATC